MTGASLVKSRVIHSAQHICVWLAQIATLTVTFAGCNPASRNADKKSQPAQPLIIYCAASNKAVLEAITADYEREFGVPVQLQFGASQTLLASLEVSGTGDLYLPADDSYLDFARQRKLLGDQFPLATMQPLVGVAQGNPKQIKSLDDLLRDDVRLAQANPDAAAVGKLTRDALTKIGKWETLEAKTAVFKTNVNEVANDIKLGAVDAGIIYDSLLHDYPTLAGVPLAELADTKARVAVALLNSTRQPAAARQLARYIAAEDKGLRHYREFGFQTVAGEAFSSNATPASSP